jgi:hypothetical protein
MTKITVALQFAKKLDQKAMPGQFNDGKKQ